jgi:tetratricopeptide (TPR) repeat protein
MVHRHVRASTMPSRSSRSSSPKRASNPAGVPSPDGFTREIERALDDYADAQALGERSPLAAPYFLGHLLAATPAESPAARGRALQGMLLTAAETLDASQHALLTQTYFKRDPRLNNVGVALALGLNDRTFYRNRDAAVAALAAAVTQRVLPPIRLEAPLGAHMSGRETLLAECVAALQRRESLMLLGPSGIGKTTLGAHIAAQFKRSFWLTLRIGLTDSLSSLVFALAYFLRQHGAGVTWQQLIADQGRLQTEHLLGLLRFDIGQLSDAPPLLCIDEINLLDPDIDEHACMLQLIEELRAVTPLLLIGQRSLIVVQHDIALNGFGAPELRAWLAALNMPALTPQAQTQILERTRGNPAVLTLFGALYQLTGDAQQALNGLGETPSIGAIFQRIWRHLSDVEQLVLMRLAAYTQAAPRELFSEAEASVQRLLAHALIRDDGSAGLSLMPHLRRVVAERTPAQLMPLLHLQAAEALEVRGEFTLAMQQYCAGQKPSHAVRIWFTHRARETARGHGAAALPLLMSIDPNSLESALARDTLHLVRAELLKLTGASEDAQLELSAIKRSANRSLRAYTLRLQGDVLEMQSRLDQSLKKYEEALDTLLDMPQVHAVQLLHKMSHLYKSHFFDMKKARAQALLARVRAEVAHGGVEERDGNYAEAEARYASALQLSSQLSDATLDQSDIYSALGQLQWKLGKSDEAVQSLQQALALSTAGGNVVGGLFDRYTLTAAYLSGQHFEQALAEAQDVLAIAESLNQSYLISGLSANASEACFGLGRMDDAEFFAFKSLGQEIEPLRPYGLTVLGLVRQTQGKHAEASGLLRDAVTSAQQVDDRYAEAAAWRALGDVQRAAGSLDAAREAYAHATTLYSALGLVKELAELAELAV